MYELLPYNITAIDTGLMGPGHAVCYLLESEGEAAVIETGVAATSKRVLALLDRRGIPRHKVRYIIPTHVHLDHAAGAGSLMDALPDAQLVVHPRGARHMINPTKLIAGATAVYGEEMFKKTYGKITPIPEERVIIADDNTILMIGTRRLEFRDTPGHANHHFCIWDKISQGWFSGDTLGNGYRELTSAAGPFLFPAAAPVQFDPDLLMRSIKLLMSYSPQRIYLTHFGAIEVTPELIGKFCQQIRDYTAIAEALPPEEATAEKLEVLLTDYTYKKLSEHGSLLNAEKLREITAMDIKLNSQGLAVWLSKSREKRETPKAEESSTTA